MKAFLIYHRKPLERTHDIEVLVDLAAEIDANFRTLLDAADALTPFATRFRYPNATLLWNPSQRNARKRCTTQRPFTRSS